MKKPIEKPSYRQSTLDDPDMQGVMPALMRALKRAHKIAHQTGTNIVTMREGKVVEVPPDPALYNDVERLGGTPSCTIASATTDKDDSMNTKTLFLSWQDKESRCQWFPIGRLDVDVERSDYRFRYTGGAERACREVGFSPTVDFPRLEGDYRSRELFPLFMNRVIALGRPDRSDYLRNLDLPENANPVEILSVNGGQRITDAFEVFPKIEKEEDGSFRCRFFLRGWRYMNAYAQDKTERLVCGEKLHVTLELSNPATGLAVQIQTKDYCTIGWAPHYLAGDLARAMADGPRAYAAHVVQVNPLPPPSKQRLLVELSGRWNDHEPMSDPDFAPLVE